MLAQNVGQFKEVGSGTKSLSAFCKQKPPNLRLTREVLEKGMVYLPKHTGGKLEGRKEQVGLAPQN